MFVIVLVFYFAFYGSMLHFPPVVLRSTSFCHTLSDQILIGSFTLLDC
jgi:hypothetical protein